tara:strand:+ start:306 stop:584 length:279 start_codon:yes stop_codon:yes gene_type:complete
MKVSVLFDGSNANGAGTAQRFEQAKDESGLCQAVFTGATATVALQGSLDGTNWVDVKTFTDSGGSAVLIFPNMRVNITGSNDAGTIKVLLGD